MIKLNKEFANTSNFLQQQIKVSLANIQIGIINRGIAECQHGYKLLLDALTSNITAAICYCRTNTESCNFAKTAKWIRLS